MREVNPKLNVTTEGDVSIVQFTDQKLLDEMSIMRIGEQLNVLVVEAKQPKVVLDFTNVGHMSSSALGMLITLHKRIRERDGHLRLACIQPTIYEVFVITRLNEIFQICQTRQDALESFN